MRLALAVASLMRHRARTLLAVAGVAVSAAMLLNMVMLATGMRESFRGLLASRGFELRLSPKGTLPFDGEATIGGAAAMVRAIRALPEVAIVSPVLGAALHVPRSAGATSAFGIGMEPAVQADYTVVAGREPTGADEIVGNDALLRAVGARPGDTLSVAVGYDPQLASYSGLRRFTIVGRARFTFLSVDQRAMALPLATLQSMGDADRRDRVSLVMVRLRAGSDVETVRTAIEREFPRVTALSTAKALEQAEQRLSYFRQMAQVLGSLSLVVGFLLVTTLVTVSVNERMGEIAVMRAIGVSTAHVVQQVVIEGLALSGAGTVVGFALGLGTARWLNSILTAFPGLPAAIDFFLLQPSAVAIALGLLLLCGVLAGIFPAWRAASLPIATTLRREAVA